MKKSYETAFGFVVIMLVIPLLIGILATLLAEVW